MSSPSETAKEILCSAIEKGLVMQVNSDTKDPKDFNKATAESIAEMYDIIHKSVLKTQRG